MRGEVMKYKPKQSNVIDAIQFKGEGNKYSVVEFLKGSKFDVQFVYQDQIRIAMGDEDYFSVYKGDYVIKDENGRISSRTKTWFESNYEPA
jgi:nitrogen regulatory protein PII